MEKVITVMERTYEELKELAAKHCIELFKSVKPKDVVSLPDAARALWKIGWEMSAQSGDRDEK